LQQFIERLDLSDMTLMVHATAGPSAMEVAIRERSRVKNLVVSNSFAWPLGDNAKLRRIVRVVSSRFFAMLNVHLNLLPRVAARLGRRGTSFSTAEREAILSPYRHKDARRHLQELLTSLRTEVEFLADVKRRMAHLRDVRALILYGRHDNGFAAGFFDRWRKLLPNHRANVLDNAGHFLVEDDPEGFTAEVRRFLEEGIT
jgi:haloalkane dehalogenase